MSRIGKLPISLPAGVTVAVNKSNLVTVKGPKGELSQQIDPDLTVEINEGTVEVKRPTEQKRHKALHGLYRTLIYNMVVGVSEGFTQKLIVSGVGFKATNSGNLLELALGYSHPIVVALPPEISVATETQRGKDPVITLSGIDKQLLGQVAAKIKSLRPPEPYKGKGIRFEGEQIRRKAGKTAGK
ncbi:MAG: 50S ribosomal protein L6 [Bacteroidetes bacterium]|nr:MAG: 50S ribosomal protein L6 [Bacteroidota bacterium]